MCAIANLCCTVHDTTRILITHCLLTLFDVWANESIQWLYLWPLNRNAIVTLWGISCSLAPGRKEREMGFCFLTLFNCETFVSFISDLFDLFVNRIVPFDILVYRLQCALHIHTAHFNLFCFVLLSIVVGCTAPNSNSSIPCNGHGKCETRENGQSCSCYYGFTGPYCEHSKWYFPDFLNSDFWRNAHEQWTTEIYDLYSISISIQIDLNDCLPNPCKNNGMCLDGDGRFTCKCAPGWSGRWMDNIFSALFTVDFEWITDAKKKVLCLFFSVSQFECLGKTCTERITQCYSGQCANGGSCAPTIIGGEATSVCICSNGWGGAFCTEPIDQCQGQPCHNGGQCESGTGWFRCACAQGFSGPDCRINVNECSPQPCLGGATCIDGIGGYTCICPKGRRGLRCEICKRSHNLFQTIDNPIAINTDELNSFSIIRSVIGVLEHNNTVTIQCNRSRNTRQSTARRNQL